MAEDPLGAGWWGLVGRLALFFGVGTALVLVADASGATAWLGGALTLLWASVLAGFAVLRLDGLPPGALGFPLHAGIPRELGLGLGLGLALGLCATALVGLGGGLALTREAGTPLGWLAAGWHSLAFFALPAAAEEALARGYPFQVLAARFGGLPALGLTSVAFAALHLSNPDVTPLALASLAAAGALLGMVYLRTLSLWWASAVHLGWNWGLGFWADLPVSGLDLVDAPYLVAAPRGPTWWGGGAFGPEGGLAALIVLCAATVWLARTGRLSPAPATLMRGPLPRLRMRHSSEGSEY
ncbi:MAG: CPBP family intramembrane glutamic endopeptidase [Gemmatimonadota bacterium]